MSQFTSGFWDIYIGLITIISIVGCGVFLWLQSRRRATAGGKETTGHTWDEDLGEYNNPMPSWWMWLFYITLVFSAVYLVLYPGLGSWQGVLGWSQVGQFEAEAKRHEAQFGPVFAKYAAEDAKVLAGNPQAMAIAQRLFVNNCAQCHASDGGGSRGFPSLADRDWLWGAEPDTIRATIRDGRNGIMPALGAALGEQGTRDVAQYVLSLSGGAHDSIRAARGEALFMQQCAACHGRDGTGNRQLGAPNLTDRIWVYGPGEPMIIESIVKGRNNMMPAHKDLLSEGKINLLTAYVLLLSQQAGR